LPQVREHLMLKGVPAVVFALCRMTFAIITQR